MKRANLVEFVLELGLLELNFDVVEKDNILAPPQHQLKKSKCIMN